MTRQARGGGPGTVGASSATAEEETGTIGERIGTIGERIGTGADHAHRLRRKLVRADLGAVPKARRELRELLRHWGRPGRSEIAELLTSELVTNALVHTDDDAVLTAVVSPDGLRVEVRDFVARRPRLCAPDTGDGTHGRGLILVQSLADAWGVSPHGVGKSVWFELGAEAA